MRNPVVALLLSVGVAACASAASDTAATPPEPVTEMEASPDAAAGAPSVHTAAQAQAGEEAFDQNCSECHSSREFSGTEFQYAWGRRTARSFYRLIARTMPDDAPGSLSADQYVAITAYVLDMNGYPAGSTPLTADEEAMRSIRLDAHAGGNE